MLRSKDADFVERVQVFASGEDVTTKLTFGFGQNPGIGVVRDGSSIHAGNLQLGKVTG